MKVQKEITRERLRVIPLALAEAGFDTSINPIQSLVAGVGGSHTKDSPTKPGSQP